MGREQSRCDMYVGVDIGGTKVAYAVIDTAKGTVWHREVMPTDADAGHDAVLARIVAVVRRLQAQFPQLRGIGVGVPGVFDDATGETLFLPNLKGTWAHVPVIPMLTQALGLPAWLINDARAFVLGEALYGAGRGHANVVGFTIGTGIGGGVVIQQQLYLGIRGTAGEFGHQTLALEGPTCGCGNVGCLEAFASGSALVRMAQAAMDAGHAPTLVAQVNAGVELTPAAMAASADEAIQRIMEQAYRYIGAGVANAVSMFSPDVVVIGGSVSNLGEPLLARIRDVVRMRCRATPVAEVTIARAALAGDAGVMGAACWAAYRHGAMALYPHAGGVSDREES